MIDLTRALVSHLRADVILAEKLGSFMGHPAVFGGSPVPSVATKPFIVIDSVSDETIEAKNVLVREVQKEIGIYDDDDGSQVLVEQIGEYLREKLRGPITVPDWNVSSLELSGPVPDDPEGLFGRLLTARVVLDR